MLTAQEDQDNGCIINTCVQVASDPTKLAISCQMGNLTREIIERTGKFNVSVLTEKVPFETIQLNVPMNCEEYLADRWGDYMKIPPLEETLKYHHSWKWSDKDFFPGYKKNNEYKDEEYLLA